jgi:hypothetical protein
MSVAVSLDALQARVAEFGDHPYLITIGEGGRAHVVSVSSHVDDGQLLLSAGRTSRANIKVNAAVTVLWAAPEGGEYCLLVDGESDVPDDEDGDVVVRPTRAVLHRVAGASTDIPSCIPLEEPA